MDPATDEDVETGEGGIIEDSAEQSTGCPDRRRCEKQADCEMEADVRTRVESGAEERAEGQGRDAKGEGDKNRKCQKAEMPKSVDDKRRQLRR
jgi:hypothetical protein